MKILKYNVVWEGSVKTRKPRMRYIVPLPQKTDKPRAPYGERKSLDEYKAYKRAYAKEHYARNVEKVLEKRRIYNEKKNLEVKALAILGFDSIKKPKEKKAREVKTILDKEISAFLSIGI